jgi:hypothetical protein
MRNGEKTNGKTKIVGTVKPPEEKLMEHMLSHSSFKTTFDCIPFTFDWSQKLNGLRGQEILPSAAAKGKIKLAK